MHISRRCGSDLERGTWIDPDAGKVTFAAYADRWLTERPELRPRTRELYEGQLRLHINPVLGDLELAQITPSRIRTWRAEMIAAGGPGPSTTANCYRLVHAVFATVVEDGAVIRNPCVVKGASAEKPAERPVATDWGRACRRTGIDGLRFHDLRHTGNTLAAATGASTKELMSRMGHASSRAALIYQHATRDRDAAIADSAPW